jgi:hypothetical protein
MNAWIVVIAVILRAATTAHRRETIRIQIKGQTLIQLTVAIVVQGVANFRGTRLDTGIIVVTVRARSRHATSRNTVEAAAGTRRRSTLEGILIDITIVRRGLADVVLINLPIAVIINAVASLRNPRVNIRIAVVAVVLGAAATAHRGIPVSVQVKGKTLINLAVAVVVHAIARFDRTRMNAWIVVVTVILRAATTAQRGITVAIKVEGQTLVNLTVAIVVNAVANLRGTRLDARIIVVTVRPRRRHATSRNTVEAAAGTRRRSTLEGILIDITIVRRGLADVVLINLPIAVIINAVARFSNSRMNARIIVVAVISGAAAAAQRGVPIPIKVKGQTLINLTVAIVIHAVADLSSPRMHIRILVVAVVPRSAATAKRGVSIPIKVEGQVLINLTVTVVINAVAGLLGTRLNARIIIIAVRTRRGRTSRRHAIEGAASARCSGTLKTITIIVAIIGRGLACIALVNLPVAVVVNAVAHVNYPRMDVEILVIAVTAHNSRTTSRNTIEAATGARSSKALITVPIRVTIVGSRLADVVLINLPITIIINAVAGLHNARMD